MHEATLPTEARAPQQQEHVGLMSTARHIVVVDDDREVRGLLAQFFEKHGFRVTAIPDGRSLRRVLATQRVDLVVLDIMLPGGEDGLTICRRLSMEAQIPIIMLTARGDEVDRIIGLEIGADDYLAKPFNPRELLARARNVLRRWELAPRKNAADGVSRYRFAGWTLDAAARELIHPDGTRQTLTGAEYRLLLAFVSHPNRVLTRHQLIELTSTRRAELFDRSIDVRVSRLRQLLRDPSRTSHIIKTVYGDGYVLSAAVEVE
ncbi:MAG TPA: response regulator [Steroidobacteraceae bacterium]|nr:response regulator [Steroidobacteraceae bacterium]